MKKAGLRGLRVWLGVCFALIICRGGGGAEITILNYNVAGIDTPGTDGRQALERVVDYFGPDVAVFQEAGSIDSLIGFLARYSGYEGFCSSADAEGNRRFIMSRYDIVDSSVREYDFTDERPRTIFAATIDLPGPRDLEVFTANWHDSEAGIRVIESARSAAVVSAHLAEHPNSLYVYAGDFNEEDQSLLLTNLLAKESGLNMFTPVDLNNGEKATISSDPSSGTYLERRVDYVLPSEALLRLVTGGRVLNTRTYPAATLPPGLASDGTVEASNHLPVFMAFDLPVADLNEDHIVNFVDFALLAGRWQETGCGDCGGADLTGDAAIDWEDMRELAVSWLRRPGGLL